ncbi:MAG: hypothetical protein ABIZ95_03960, partial [Pyrinomonadaceae bacterium]
MSKSCFQTVIALVIVFVFATAPLGQELTKVTTIKQLRRLPRGVTEQTLRKHEFEPANVLDVELEETDPAREVNIQRQLPEGVTTGKLPKLDANAFATSLDQYLNTFAGAGYALQINQNGTPIY